MGSSSNEITRRQFVGRGAVAASAVGLGLGLAGPVLERALGALDGLSPARAATYQALLTALALAPEAGVGDVAQRMAALDRWYASSTETRAYIDAALDGIEQASPAPFAQLPDRRRLALLRSWVARDPRPSATSRQRSELVAAGVTVATMPLTVQVDSPGPSVCYLRPS